MSVDVSVCQTTWSRGDGLTGHESSRSARVRTGENDVVLPTIWASKGSK
jgi:hypothetical protein